jgi:hypothetical protein
MDALSSSSHVSRSHTYTEAVRDGILGTTAQRCRRALTGEHGTALPPFFDAHVHLHLIDEKGLAAGGIAGVLDLGGDPAALARRRHDAIPRVAYAGAMLTGPGGYPSGREWAPAAIWRAVSSPSSHPGAAGGAATVVDEQASFGAVVVKVALNAAAGPVLDAATLGALVAAARGRGMPVVAHVEGAGETCRSLDAGVDVLAHVPFTERVGDDDIARAVAGQRWISTLDIHTGADRDRATDNLARFAAAGGRVHYGTDLGNGERPPGIQRGELQAMDAAGIRGDALIAALTDPWPLPPLGGVATFIPGQPPDTLDDVPAWLALGTVVPDEELIRDDD